MSAAYLTLECVHQHLIVKVGIAGIHNKMLLFLAIAFACTRESKFVKCLGHRSKVMFVYATGIPGIYVQPGYPCGNFSGYCTEEQ